MIFTITPQFNQTALAHFMFLFRIIESSTKIWQNIIIHINNATRINKRKNASCMENEYKDRANVRDT